MASAAPIVAEDADVDTPANDAGPLTLIAKIAQSRGDISYMLDEQTLTKIGADVVQDYDRDCQDRHDWEETVTKALARAAQEKNLPENPPPYRRSHVDYPILTVAAQQFNARSYPAICKPGEMVRVKVIGSDKGRPQVDPQSGEPLVSVNGQPMTISAAQAAMQQAQASAPPPAPGQPGQPDLPEPQPLWQIPPGAKQARADRVADYLNVYLEFRMDDWEEDTDLMLMQVPIVGCGFRKLWWAEGEQKAAYIPALDLVVPMSAKSLETTPRATERMSNVYPYQLRQRMNAKEYRTVDFPSPSDDMEEPRLLLEQHRLLDLDDDGVDEPYIVTVDKETSQVLKLEANFGPDQVKVNADGTIARIDKEQFYVKYPFLPDPKGGFYDIGFGHLIEQLGDVINAAINQILDAGHAQIAGGGFIAASLRLQSNNRTETMRWMPGEYKVVNVAGGDLRNGIYERTFPNPSQIIFNLLELMLGAAKEVTSVKDITTGDAPNTAPVGTTLALIEQGLQVFTAIYKRIYRSLGQEFSLIFNNIARFGGDEAAEDYMNVLDDPAANFEKDFADGDIDIKPVADPTAVTSQQRLAKAQIVMQTAQGNPLIDQKEALTRVYQAAGIENIDALFAPQSGPDPMALAELAVKTSTAALNNARAQQAGAMATKVGVDVGHQLGEAEGYGGVGGLPDVAGASGIPVGAGGAGAPGAGPAAGVGAGVVGAGGQ